jgi:citrate lyase subunit beta/citryl-CoA lyase
LRSLLFVPGDSERKQAKALASEADALILDLEDSVAPEQRDAARRRVHDFLAAAGTKRTKALWVRPNGPDSGLLADDLAAVAAGRPDGILLPKVSGVRALAAASAEVGKLEARHSIPAGSIRLAAIVTETPRALLSLGEFAPGIDSRVSFLTWGMEDLAAALGASGQREDDGSLTPTFQLARTLCLVAASAAGALAIDGVYTDFRDAKGLAEEARRARRDGFSGKLAIHPDQIPVIHAAFSPSAAEVERAERIVAAFAAASGTGVTSLDGKMIDRPHLIHAQRVLALAGRKTPP